MLSRESRCSWRVHWIVSGLGKPTKTVKQSDSHNLGFYPSGSQTQQLARLNSYHIVSTARAIYNWSPPTQSIEKVGTYWKCLSMYRFCQICLLSLYTNLVCNFPVVDIKGLFQYKNRLPRYVDSLIRIRQSYFYHGNCNTGKIILHIETPTSVISFAKQACLWLTHRGRDKLAGISQTTLSNAFSWMKMY